MASVIAKIVSIDKDYLIHNSIQTLPDRLAALAQPGAVVEPEGLSRGALP